MLPDWVPDVRTRLLMLGITDKQFAKECGYDKSWLCQILRGRRKATKAKDRILATFDRLEAETRGVQGDIDSSTSGETAANPDGVTVNGGLA